MVLFKSFLIPTLILLMPLTHARSLEKKMINESQGKKKPQKQEEQIRQEKLLRWQENQMNQQFNRDIHIDPYSREKQKQEERERELMHKAEDEFNDGMDF